jgi:hypothetical protein
LREEQAGIHPIGLAGMDAVGDPEDVLARRADAVRREAAAIGDDEQVDR